MLVLFSASDNSISTRSFDGELNDNNTTSTNNLLEIGNHGYHPKAFEDFPSSNGSNSNNHGYAKIQNNPSSKLPPNQNDIYYTVKKPYRSYDTALNIHNEAFHAQRGGGGGGTLESNG